MRALIVSFRSASVEPRVLVIHAGLRQFGLGDAALQVVLAFQRAELGGDQAQHHALVALGKVAQRLEGAGALAVVFQKDRKSVV